tara:strand:- start:7 stop:252 length:246 start_codon:yes stop_codon:yes gene_type:complete
MQSIKRRNGRVPFGYEENAEDRTLLDPIPEQLEALEEIKTMVSQGVLSLREGSAWILHKTGRSLSYQGLKDKVDGMNTTHG